MISDNSRAVRKVLTCISELEDALNDVILAMREENIVAAKMALAHIIKGAEKAIEALTPKET